MGSERDRARQTTLRLVSDRYVWRRVGKQKPVGVVELPTASAMLNGNVVPGPLEFAVDYANGVITIGRPLQTGPLETITITADPMDNMNQIGVAGGTFQTNLNDRTIVKAQFDLDYTPGQSLHDWLATNLTTGTPAGNHRYGNWLTGTSSEMQIEFICGTDNKTPLTPLDGRFLGATAQPYASSSYGTLQVLLKTWADQRLGQRLRDVLDPANEPVFNVLSDWKRGLRLGGRIHQAEYDALVLNNAVCSPCTTDQWIDLWNGIFRSYNPGGNGYSATPRIEIIQAGLAYEPR
jgi:hypothetical protein